MSTARVPICSENVLSVCFGWRETGSAGPLLFSVDLRSYLCLLPDIGVAASESANIFRVCRSPTAADGPVDRSTGGRCYSLEPRHMRGGILRSLFAHSTLLQQRERGMVRTGDCSRSWAGSCGYTRACSVSELLVNRRGERVCRLNLFGCELRPNVVRRRVLRPKDSFHP